ncbi:hypothetical protein AHAS_AhasUnG0015700 [Arachis hypogaea]
MLSTLCMMCSCCNERDKEILLKFKEGVADPSGLLSSWKQEQDCCQWKGVRCHNITARVIHLSLRCDYYDPVELVEHDNYYLQKCLTGDINLSLLDMEYLQSLDLRFNDFATISSDSTVNSSTLNYIDLSYNKYLSIKSLQWLSRIPSLEYIDLSHIDLHMETNWLHFVTVLPSLVELHLDGCNLESISPSLGYANFSASLQVIALSGNSFYSEMPKWIFNLSSHVHQIDLSSNYFMGQLPNTLPNLHSLISLQLHDNYLNGSIPDWIGQLHYLTTFEIDNNHFSGFFPTNLGNLSSLDTLTAHRNLFTGVVSERNFAKLKNLKFLSLVLPYITFDFDPLWIPPFQLDKLFTSTIQHLDFDNNTIEGDLSEVVLNSSIIELTSNNFKGGLPRLSSNVVFFQLYNSSLSGSISHLLCHSKKSNNKLQYLDISDNNLSGGLTDCWMNWKSLVYVNLGGNNLSGSIPPSMALLSNLTSLHLHENNLSGDISSSSLQYCRSLSILNVRENSFSGNIPKWMPQSIRILQLRLTGTIPKEIGNMKQLESLDLSKNDLTGEIPESMSSLSFLNNLNLSFNNLRGQIPSGTQLQSFSELSYIGNADLCGPPLPKNCSNHGDDTKASGENDDDDGDESDFLSCLYMGLGVGFASGFCGVCGAIFFGRKCRHAYFRFLYDLRDRFYVLLLTNLNSFH